MRVVTPINVRYGDTDKMGVVYHANYLLYCEDGRTDFLNKLGFPYSEMEAQGLMSPVLSFDIHYGAPVQYGDPAVVETWVCESRVAKTRYAFRIYRCAEDVGKVKPCCWGTSWHCLVDANTFRPVNYKKALPRVYELYNDACEDEIPE